LGLNEGVKQANGDIIIFSDANAMYGRQSVRALVWPLADPQVGCVTGEQRYFSAESGSAGESEGIYWRYEQSIKRWESAASSLVGGDGAIYAIRKGLYTPMRPEDVSDFVNPLQIVMAGYRNVYQPDAYAMEHSGDSDTKEYRRKTRIVNQAWRATWQHAEILNPARYGVLAVQMWSHKVLRWLAAIPLVTLLVSSWVLWPEGGIYSTLFGLQIVAYLLASAGAVWPSGWARPRITSVPYYFVLVNFASLHGIMESIAGKTYATWATVREG
jgi:cellulose synthase/poly-beta-1,6-N-acetylglucosamine synthase-like glycosyltransferase